MNSFISYKEIEEGLLIKFDGELDNLATYQYKTKLCDVISKYRNKKVLFDLSNLAFIDSSGIGLILGRFNQVKSQNGNLIICGVNNQIKKTLQISGLAKIIDIYEDVYENIKKSEVLS